MKKIIAFILSMILVAGIVFPVAAFSTVKVKSITLNTSKISMKVGESYQLKATLAPKNTTQKILSFVLSNKNIAKVDKNGKITALKAGTTEITVISVSNKNVLAKCKITVAPNVKWDISKKRKIVLSTINQFYTTALKQVAKDYTALHPETTVEIEIIADGGTYAQNWKTKMAANRKTAADIIHTNLMGDEAEFTTKGWFTALDGLINEQNPYNDNKKVRDAIDAKYVNMAMNATGKTAHLPFDLVGLSLYYNKDIFKKVGIKAPTTYQELINVCQKLKDAGYENPIGATVFADWMKSSMMDSANRAMIEKMITLPGDGRWDEKAMASNLKVKYSPNNPDFDSMAIIDPEKALLVRRDFDRTSKSSKYIWETYKKVTKYFQQGFLSPDGVGVYNQFLAQRTPIYIDGSWTVGKLSFDVKKLMKDKRFNWATFPFPQLDAAAGTSAKVRGLLVPGHKLGISQKNDKDLYYRAADFLKYMYSPKVAQKIYEITIDKGELVQGPPLVQGVKVSSEILGYLDGFKVAGSMRWEYGDLELGTTTQADAPKWSELFMNYVSDKITWDQFVQEKEKLIQNHIKEQQEKMGYDMDSKTAEQLPK